VNVTAALSTEARAMDTAVAAHKTAAYVLKLYVVGSSPRSARAISNVRKICDEHLEGRHSLEVVDISQHGAMAKREQIFAAPTLIKESPLPARRFIGDMAQSERILRGLDLRGTVEKASPATNAGPQS
jgi:circadian clock protein KaiB